MNISDKDFDNLVLAITEKVLLRMPEVIGNLMMNHAEVHKLTKGFYEKYPTFKENPFAVRSVLEQLEQENSGMSYDKLLNKAVPKIKERLKQTEDLNTSASKPIESLNLSIADSNGVL